MWPRTKATGILKTVYPIIQAPMAGAANSPELIAAVANAGALGSLAAGYMQPAEMKDSIQQIRKLTNNIFAVNLFIPHEHHATEEQILKAIKVIELACYELKFHIEM